MVPKYFKYFIWLTIIVFAGCTNNEGYVVKGYITNNNLAIEKGTAYLFNKDMSVSDTATITNGKFIFKGKLEEPDLFYLMIEGSGAHTRVFLENEQFEITATLDNNLNNPQISGGTNQKLINAQNEKQNQLARQYNFHKLNKEYNNPTTNRKRQKEIEKIFETIKEEMLQFQYSLMDKHPSSYYTLKFLADNIDKLPLQQIEERMEPFVSSPRFSRNKDLEILVSSVNQLKTIQPGKPAPDFSMPDKEGNLVKFSDIYKENKITMLDFWASWCAPCRKMHPQLKEMYQKYHPKGFQIVAVSFDNSREKWEEAIKEDSLPWIHLSDLQYWNSAPRDLYQITYVPQYILVDSTGTIVRLKIGEEQVQEFLNNTFK
ncbi:MAG: TlpA disulfide reductase family protein [Bacteroidales bacterium]|nr:TlpA disulfide reductase family protein [Bacteroidales bacterium]